MIISLWNLLQYHSIVRWAIQAQWAEPLVSLCLEILTWFLLYKCIMMSYRSSLHFVPVQLFLVKLWPLDWNLAKYLVVTKFFSLCLKILTWFLVWECIIISYRLTLKFIPVEWFLANLQPLGFEIWPNILLLPLYFTMIWDIDLIFGMRV
jgi:hypothetical protein